MPLAIELAAARVEALGVAQLLDRRRAGRAAAGGLLAPGPAAGRAGWPAPVRDAGNPAGLRKGTADRGRTNAQIAAELYISVRTVSSHLDRIRDKTGCRRRADLTRLALTSGLV
jgi:Bacterial regulatory proteins, luxR family